MASSARTSRGWSSRFTFLATMGLLCALALSMTPPRGQRASASPGALPIPLAPADFAVSVALAGPSHLNQTHLGTNLTTPSEVLSATDPTHGSLLQAWSPALVRLHLGFTGDEIGLPEMHQGQWDFAQLDAAIARLRATHTPFFLNVRTAPSWMYDASGQLRDQTYQEFAAYMARLVGWYNAGGFTDEAGHFHASGHQGWVGTWEIWNEPNSGYDIPGPVSHRSATWLDAHRFARLYSVAAMAMRAVDPTIATGGPAISAYPDDGYMINFIQGITAPLDFFSFHFYAIGNQQTPDPAVFRAVAETFAHRLAFARVTLDARFPGKAIPIWVDEVGFNEIARYPVDPRGAAPVGIVFAADAFITAAQHDVTQFTQFPFLGNAQLALVDNQRFAPYVPLRFYEVLGQTFPPGVRLLRTTLAPPTGLVVLAALAPDGSSVRVLLANTRAAQPTDVNGAGVAATVRITFTNVAPGAGAHAGSVSNVWSFDATTDPAKRAQAHPVAVFTGSDGGLSVQVGLAGYGVSIIQLLLH
ncbi:MAG: hypothetical protein H0X24_18985 [Ktedonobacterales bacterium]|nr:hypothetical protein [Ktedonobacterales bacterium]